MYRVTVATDTEYKDIVKWLAAVHQCKFLGSSTVLAEGQGVWRMHMKFQVATEKQALQVVRGMNRLKGTSASLTI